MLAIGATTAHDEVPMVRANCRARFTAADFDFILRTLARSQTNQVSLVDLLSDVETRDSILDHPRLVDAILNHCGHLRISSQFYFYVLARHVLQQGGIATGSFVIMSRRCSKHFRARANCKSPESIGERVDNTFHDILIALTRATPEQAFCSAHT